MRQLKDFRKLLSEIINLLESAGESSFAVEVKSEIGDCDESLRSFLVSNELWGGAGSLADSAFAFDERRPNWTNRAEGRATLERLMIQLGRLQIQAGQVNPRTQMWVETFEHWRNTGLR